MKKKIFLMLPCIAAVAIATFVGKKTFESHAYETSSLLMQNVEALSQSGGDEGGNGDDSPCSSGFPHFARIANLSGKIEIVRHYADGDNGNYGIDAVYIKDYAGCIADGSGNLKGGDFSYHTDERLSSYQECKGAVGHKETDLPN